mmetsp:Transcript_18537/g.31030  ORF Transcript_18537/g.31030 Transcript_18537/m.31030 type:complete len:102 (+) Transcript_18537:63-368(+)
MIIESDKLQLWASDPITICFYFLTEKDSSIKSNSGNVWDFRYGWSIWALQLLLQPSLCDLNHIVQAYPQPATHIKAVNPPSSFTLTPTVSTKYWTVAVSSL